MLVKYSFVLVSVIIGASIDSQRCTVLDVCLIVNMAEVEMFLVGTIYVDGCCKWITFGVPCVDYYK